MTVLTNANPSASRLCDSCGLCCNGVLFHTVRLHPGDSPKELSALGLKLKRKQGRQMLLQPCPAYRDAQCSIYESRPQRCRLFECRQLKGVAAGEISFATALERIREVHRRVEHMNALLGRAGVTDPKKPLSKRCEKILAEPLDPSADLAATDLRKELTREMLELDAMLDTHFRVTAPGDRQPPPTPRPTAYVGTDSVLPSNVAR